MRAGVRYRIWCRFDVDSGPARHRGDWHYPAFSALARRETEETFCSELNRLRGTRNSGSDRETTLPQVTGASLLDHTGIGYAITTIPKPKKDHVYDIASST